MNYQCQMTLIVMLLIAVSGGCGSVDPPDSLTFYSIDGRDFRPGEEPDIRSLAGRLGRKNVPRGSHRVYDLS